MDLLVNREVDTKGYGDMVFINGDTPITYDFTDGVAQKVFILLRTFESEWFLNETTGIPYLTRILGHRTDKFSVDRIIQQKILQEPGVADILEYISSISSGRLYTARMRIRDTSGNIFSETLITE